VEWGAGGENKKKKVRSHLDPSAKRGQSEMMKEKFSADLVF